MWRTIINYLTSLSDFTPKSLTCFKEGYTLERLRGDILAGVTVGIISLPLAMAFAIGSGVNPDRGLFTAIVAGFLISFLGGSRVQIGGPTGAFIVIVYATVQKHGYDGLALATFLAGFMILLLGLVRAGVLLKFIPYPVTTGFTAGIAVSLCSSQVKDFFGLKMASVPPDFIEKINQYTQYASTWNPWAVGMSVAMLVLIFWLRARYPRLPGVIIATILATAVTWIFDLPIETIMKKFGEIPRTLPEPALPFFSWEKLQAVFPDAITIAMLGAIESLLSAVVADGMTGNKHRSNTELVAQGIANIFSPIFGGIPATGAVARTAANIKLGATTPLAGMLHAVTVLLLMFVFAPVASQIPLAALAAILVFVAYNMSEREHFMAILRGPRSDALILLITFALTVLIDLTVAVQIGVVLAAISFLKKMSESSTVEVCKILLDENVHEKAEESGLIFRKDVPENVAIFEINGPFFFGVTEGLNEELRQLETLPDYFILRISRMSMIDASGIHAMKQFAARCREKGIILLLSGVRNPQIVPILKKNGVLKAVGEDHVFTHFDYALDYVKKRQQATFADAIPAPSV